LHGKFTNFLNLQQQKEGDAAWIMGFIAHKDVTDLLKIAKIGLRQDQVNAVLFIV
jgi:hypothetical protein